VEKRKPTYDLASIRAAFLDENSLRLSRTAIRCVRSLGFSRTDVVEVIQALRPSHFYKSMTTYADHTVWQDVYHARHQGIDLYVKFQMAPGGYLIISFKER